MHIKQKITQHRRDFTAIYQCEHCGHEITEGGYDDTYFHENVIPEMKCPKCEKKADEDYQPQQPQYPDGVQI